MNSRTPAQRVAIAFGIALVMMGSMLLLDRLGHLFSLGSFAHSVSAIVWPTTLVVAGVLMLRARKLEPATAGASAAGDQTAGGLRRLSRSRTDRVITGVLGGFAHYIGAPAGLVRAVFVLLTLMAGIMWGVVVYAAGTLLIPDIAQYPAVAVQPTGQAQ